MLMVIMEHLPLFCYFEKYNMGFSHSYLRPIVCLIELPLFMAISGYVCKYDSFKLSPKWKLLIPFFVIGMFFNACILVGNPLGFLANPKKWGYWFFWAIFVFFVLLYLIRRVRLNLYLGSIIVWGLLLVIGHYLPSEWRDYLSWGDIELLWPYFAWGVILKRLDFEKHIHNKRLFYIFTPLLIGILLIFCKRVTHIMALSIIAKMSLIVLLIVLFHDLENLFKGKSSKFKTIIKKVGTDIGTNTLQIYALHFIVFRYTRTPSLGNFLLDRNMLWAEFIISPVLALLIAYICIYAAKLLYKLHLGFIFGR